jgi:hypothetical protein
MKTDSHLWERCTEEKGLYSRACLCVEHALRLKSGLDQCEDIKKFY